LGRKLGFPTANLDRRQFTKLKNKPRLGVWAGIATYHLSPKSYKLYKAGIVIGPKDKQGLPKIEAYLLGFKGNLYGKQLVLEPVKFLRPFKHYSGTKSLIAQIQRDVQQIQKLLT